MLRRLPALALWLASAGLAGWLVWYGIGSIGDAGRSETSIAVAVPADTTTADQPADVTPVSPAPVRLVVPTVDVDAAAELDPTAESVATPARPTPTNTPGPAQAPTPSAATPTPAAAPASSPTPSAAPSPQPTSVIVQAPIVQSFTVVGGVATVQFSASAVTVLAATPNAGYTTKISQNGATQVRVEFESDDGRSRLDARWQGGPVHEIDEN